MFDNSKGGFRIMAGMACEVVGSFRFGAQLLRALRSCSDGRRPLESHNGESHWSTQRGGRHLGGTLVLRCSSCSWWCLQVGGGGSGGRWVPWVEVCVQNERDCLSTSSG